MSSNVRIIVGNEGDGATLSVSPAVSASLPVNNLQDPARARVMRTTGLSDQQIKGTWTAPKMISACALMRHNLTSSGTVRLELFSDAAWTTTVYDSGAVASWPAKSLGDLEWGIEPLGASVFTGWGRAFSVLWFSFVTVRSFRLTLSDPTNPDGYMEAGRLFIGRSLEPMYNLSYGVEIGWRESTQQTRTDGGTLRSDPSDPYRRLRFRLESLGESDRPKFVDLVRQLGKRKDFFVSVFPGVGGMKERDYTMAAKIVNAPDSNHNTFGNYVIDFEMEEA